MDKPVYRSNPIRFPRGGGGRPVPVPANAIQNREMPLAVVIFTAFLCTLFGANAVAIKMSLAGMGPFTVAGLRFLLAAAIVSLWARATGQPFRLKRGQARKLLLLSAIFSVQLSCFYLGIGKSNASRATLIVNLQPFFVLFLAHFFIPGDRITARKFTGILLGFAGVAFVFSDRTGLTPGFQLGDMGILCAAFIWACNAVYTKRIIADFAPFQIVLYPMIASLPWFFIQAAVWDQPMIGELSPSVVGGLLYQSLVTASFGFVAWNSLLQRYGAVALHSFLFILPVSGVAFGGVLLHEPVTSRIFSALLLIVSGILVIYRKRPVRKPVQIAP